jgi:hypothetical protein
MVSAAVAVAPKIINIVKNRTVINIGPKKVDLSRGTSLYFTLSTCTPFLANLDEADILLG